MPKLDQELVLPGNVAYTMIDKNDLDRWASLFDANNPTGIAAALGLGDGFTKGQIPAYVMNYDGTLDPINPVDAPDTEDISVKRESPMGGAYRAAYNNRLFVPTKDGKLVQVSVDGGFFSLDYSLSKPIEDPTAFAPPKAPSIWKRIFFLFFKEELQEYEDLLAQYEDLISDNARRSFADARTSAVAEPTPGKPEAAGPAAAPQNSVEEFQVQLNRIAFNTTDWATAALEQEDCTVGQFCDGIAKNLERQAAQNLLREAKNDPANGNKILADARRPFQALQKGLRVFTRKDMDVERVNDLIEEGGLDSPDYEAFYNWQKEYESTALGKYNSTLAKEFEDRDSLSWDRQPQGNKKLDVIEEKPIEEDQMDVPVFGG